jgi:hypothetical protein
VTRQVEKLAVPDWVLKVMVCPLRKRNFPDEKMRNEKGFLMTIGPGDSSVPRYRADASQLWFYYMAALIWI